MDDCRHNIQNLRLSSVWNVSIIVHEDCLQKRGDHAVVNHLQVICPLNIGIDEFQDFFLDRSQPADLWRLRGNVP